MTNFITLAQFGLPQQHKASFFVCKNTIEYEVYFTEITTANSYDCAVEFDENFRKPSYAHHYDVVFDTRQNRQNKTYFQRVTTLPPGAVFEVLRNIESILLDHYTSFNVGLYTYAPADFKLSSVYCRLIAKSRFRGFTIEVGLEPVGRAHVLRTPHFYD